MSATAALAQAPETDEHDDPSPSVFSAGGQRDLAERLANARLGEEETKDNASTNPSSDRHTPRPMPSSQGLPSWPTATTPPRRTPSLQQQGDDPRPPHRSPLHPTHGRPRPASSPATPPRPPCVSSASGASLALLELEQAASLDSGVSLSREEDGECPASRAVAAMHALAATNASIVLSELNHEGGGGGGGGGGGAGVAADPRGSPREGKPRQSDRPPSSPPPSSSPPRTFPAYPSAANESLPNAHDPDPHRRDLYTFSPHSLSGRLLTALSRRCVPPRRRHVHGGSALAGFLALLLVTCANCMLGPMRDAAALAVGVTHIPALTLASTALALGSSVPVGWLFEAPDPRRRRVWRRLGLTRGETQGTSLALFYRAFAFLLLSYALGFLMVDKFGTGKDRGGGTGGEASAAALVGTFFLRCADGVGLPVLALLASLERRSSSSAAFSGLHRVLSSSTATLQLYSDKSVPSLFLHACTCLVNKSGKVIYVMFFLVVHLMKLHSLSLIWGVTTEAMEYEETAELRMTEPAQEEGAGGGPAAVGNRYDEDGSNEAAPNRGETSKNDSKPSKSSLRLKRLGFVGFGGTLGGILGSVIASFAAHALNLSGLLILAAILLELSANLSIELGRIMQRHWEEQMNYQSGGDLASLFSGENLADANGQQQPPTMSTAVDTSMRRSVSLGSMKRIASGSFSSGNLAKLAGTSQQPQGGDGDGRSMMRARSIANISHSREDKNVEKVTSNNTADQQQQQPNMIDDNSFKQRLLRGFTTILRSRLLMAIFTYNALYASTSVLLSFQRAELVANRLSDGADSSSGSAVSNTAFLAKINTASSVGVFALQASGLGAYIANRCGQRGALALTPTIRLGGVLLLGYWHLTSNGQPPDLTSFLVIDEFTKVINFAIAKPVRENLWRGLSAEARYEAKPIVDTLANRWGGGSAAFLVSFISRITDLTGFGMVNENGERSIFGFPPVLLLCIVISVWWTTVSVDVGNIRRKIDLELKKQQ